MTFSSYYPPYYPEKLYHPHTQAYAVFFWLEFTLPFQDIEVGVESTCYFAHTFPKLIHRSNCLHTIFVILYRHIHIHIIKEKAGAYMSVVKLVSASFKSFSLWILLFTMKELASSLFIRRFYRTTTHLVNTWWYIAQVTQADSTFKLLHEYSPSGTI